MKARESGMPEEEIWEKFFDMDMILNELEVNSGVKTLAEFGCGYGTFTIPACRKIGGDVYAYDIEPDLIQELKLKLKKGNIENVSLFEKDFISEGTGLENGSADYVMLFNILHAEKSEEILKEAFRILAKNGKVGVIHWIHSAETPRGPSLEIRPKPEELKNLLTGCGFSILKFNINLPPYHYGILAQK